MNARSPRSATVAPLGSDGSVGIGGSDVLLVGAGPEADGRGGVAVALAVAAGLGVALAALVDGRDVVGGVAVVATEAVVVVAPDAVGTARVVSVQPRTTSGRVTISARSALRA